MFSRLMYKKCAWSDNKTAFFAISVTTLDALIYIFVDIVNISESLFVMFLALARIRITAC